MPLARSSLLQSSEGLARPGTGLQALGVTLGEPRLVAGQRGHEEMQQSVPDARETVQKSNKFSK